MLYVVTYMRGNDEIYARVPPDLLFKFVNALLTAGLNVTQILPEI